MQLKRAHVLEILHPNVPSRRKLASLLITIFATSASCKPRPPSSSTDTAASYVPGLQRTAESLAARPARPRGVVSRPLSWQPLAKGLTWKFRVYSSVMDAPNFRFALVIKNPTSKPLRTEFAGSFSAGIYFEVQVRDSAGAEVWNNLHGLDLDYSKLGMPVLPNDSLLLSAQWRGVDNRRQRLPSGEYWAQAYLIPFVRNDPSIRSKPERLKIQ